MKKYLWVILVYVLAAIVFAMLTPDVYEEDSTMHFLMAKYSFKHQWLMVDIWARPVPTLVLSLSAQAGLLFTRVFQILIGLLSGLVGLKTAEKMGLQRRYLVAVLLLFQPFFFITSYNILTEPYFVLILMLAFYFLYAERLNLMLLTISFLPLTRTEGFLVFPFILAYLVAGKKLKVYHLLFFIIGTFAWWVSGLLVHHDMLWFVTNFPWGGGSGYYGYGKPFDYITLIPYATAYFGFPFLIYGFFKTFNRKDWIIPVLFITYLLFLSVIWWKGYLRAMLCPRYFAIMAPFAAIMMAKALDKIPRPIVIPVLCGFMVFSLRLVNQTFPFKRYPDHRTMRGVFEYYDRNMDKAAKFMCSYPYFYVLANEDPFDNEKHPAVNRQNAVELPHGSIVIWDNRFMIREFDTAVLDSLGFKRIASFENDIGFETAIYTK